MLKDFYNEIIPPWDPRYGKLGHLWKRYNYNNLIRMTCEGIIKYYLPGSLLYNLQDYRTQKVDLKVLDSESTNVCSNTALGKILENAFGLTSQEFFDLLVLHNNSRLNRPRCKWCNSYVPWSGRFTWGYNQSVYWNKVRFVYCSNSCAKHFHANNLNLFPLVAYNQDHFAEYCKRGNKKIINDYSRFMSKGNPTDGATLYIARTHNNKLKFGVTTQELWRRSYQERLNSGYEYKSIHTLFDSTREEVANLEASLKLHYEQEEYLEFSKLREFITLLRDKLRTRPILNPFD